MDDGQVVLPPLMVAAYLRAFDAELAIAGGTRMAAGQFKSVARLAGSPGAKGAVHPSWSEGVVAATCRLDADVDVSAHGKILGIELDGDSLRAQFQSASQHTAET